MTATQPRPLEGVTVVEITNYVAAPSAGAIMSDMGAEVIKIEPLGGDPWRGKQRRPKVEDRATVEFDFQFAVDNRGKKSIALDLTEAEGQAIVHKLVANAQIFLCNLLIQRQERFGLDPATLQKHNPALVHATLTGYGTTGPEAWRPGYDVTAFFGRSGLYDASREGPDGDVPMARPGQGDHTAGLALTTAILGALRLVERTGEPQVVETSLYETAVWTQACDFAVTAIDKAPLRPRSRRNMLLATANRFPCGDGKWVVINMPEDSAWPKLCKVIGKPEWLEDERFADVRGRFRNMEELVAGIDGALAAHSRDEWGEIFDREGIVWGPVLGLHEVVTDPQAEAIGLFPEIDTPGIGPAPSVRIPMRFADADIAPRGPAPTVGQHTDGVLTDAGYGPDAIAGLRNDGIVR